MDAVFFPYNSMFTIDFTKNYTASVYRLKINDAAVNITQNLYWKKDFLEESLINFTKYKSSKDLVFMNTYLNKTIREKDKRELLTKKLCPDSANTSRWLFWYMSFAGYTTPLGSAVEIWKYNLIFSNRKMIIQDSVSNYKTLF